MEFSRKPYIEKLVKHRGNGMIKTITGIRRCGKSYLLNTLFCNYLESTGVKSSNIIKFAFDFDEDIDKLDAFFPELPARIRLENGQYVISAKKFRAYIASLTPDENEYYYLLLDEVQNLENFVGTLNGYLSRKNLDVYVTGSNSQFLSSDIASEFRGRGDVIRIYPLTFNEYYEYAGGDRRQALFSYMRYGGLPRSVLAADDETRQEYLASLYKTIYLADLKERHRIRKTEEFDDIISVLASSVGSITNPFKLAATFSSVQKSRITSATIKKYIEFLSDAFLISEAKRYDVKGKKYISTLQKYYFSDLGIRNSILGFRQFEPTHLMENLIYNELIFRGFAVDVGVVEKSVLNEKKNGTHVSYEVDFVANKGSARYYIQSAYALPDEEKVNQEKRPFDNISDNFDKLLITLDDFTTYHRDQNGYTLMNLIEFLEHPEYLK